MNNEPVRLGRLYGLGVGPGAPDLITLQSHRILTRVPVVCVPQGGAGEGGIAWEIVRDFINPKQQEILLLPFPMTRDSQELQRHWGQAVGLIWERLQKGRDCAFVTQGDPLLYSTFIYVLRLMKERHPEVVIQVEPGISSITAAAASAQLPLAEGEESLAILPATRGMDAIRHALQEFDSVVLLKVNRHLPQVLRLLKEMALDKRAVFVSRVTTSQETVVTSLAELRDREIDYLSLLIVRKGAP